MENYTRHLTSFSMVIYQAEHGLWCPVNVGWENFALLQKFPVKFAKSKSSIFHLIFTTAKSYLPKGMQQWVTCVQKMSGIIQYEQSFGWNSKKIYDKNTYLLQIFYAKYLAYHMKIMYETNSFFLGLLLAPPRLGLVLLGLLLLAALVPLLVIITLFLFIL